MSESLIKKLKDYFNTINSTENIDGNFNGNIIKDSRVKLNSESAKCTEKHNQEDEQ